jgi:signal transduction histidine kinase/DNA-binding response OmpR family regulator
MLEKRIGILHLEDDAQDAELAQALLENAGLACQITRVQARQPFEAALQTGSYDVILADYRLPSYDGLSALRFAQAVCPEIPFIFVSGTLGEDAAIEGLTQGATDYVLKQKLSRLAPAVRRALREADDIAARQQAEERIHQAAVRAEALVRIAARLNAQLDLEVILQAVCEEAALALNVPIASIDIFDEPRQVFCGAAAVGLPAGYQGHRIPRADLDAVVAQFGERSVVPDLQAAADILNAQRHATLGLRTAAYVTLRHNTQWVGTLNIATVGVGHAFTDEELNLLQGLADQATQAITNARLYTQVRQGCEQLQRLSRQLIEAQETERRTIARELHDQVGQNLTGLSLNLNILRSQLGATTTAPISRRLDDSLTLVGEIMQRIRGVMAELRPPALDEYGLLAALRWHGEQVAARTGLAVHVEGADQTPRLAPSVENALFRIAQEALTNIVKHAHAKQALLTLEGDPDLVRLTINDDGTGFDPAALHRGDGQPGWGLTSIRERATAVEGRLRIESTPGQGTVIMVEVNP